MKLRLYIPLLIIWLIWPGAANAQVSLGGKPYSFSPHFQQNERVSVPQMVLPKVNIEAIKKEFAKKGVSNLYAKAHWVDYSLENSGLWTVLPNGDRLWRLETSMEGALSLEARYKQFFLPPGARFFLYSKDRTKVLGAFSSLNNKKTGRFSTEIILKDHIVFEYYEPATVRGQGIIHIDRIDYGFDQFKLEHLKPKGNRLYNGLPLGDADDCNVNINCTEGSNLQDEKKGVARIGIVSDAGSGWCTGSLINNVNNDGTPYFLTAWHCQDGATQNYDQWIFYFNFESADCGNPSVSPESQTVVGCELKELAEGTDVLLLLLNEGNSLPTTYDLYYNGWNANDNVLTNTVRGIHHPRGDIKKLSVASAGTTENDSQLNFTNSQGVIAIRIPAFNAWGCIWTTGTTEPGSSGSPLLDDQGRILGQLTGGSSSCDNLSGGNWYGKLSKSWSLLKPYLDPDNTGQTTLSGVDPNTSIDDVGVLSITTDQNVCDLGTNSTFKIQVKNFSLVDQQNVALNYEVKDERNTTVTSGSFNIASLTGNSTAEESVSFDVELGKTYKFKAYTGLTGDANSTNDTVSAEFANPSATTLASGLAVTEENATTLKLTWTNGNGESRLVLAKEGSDFTAADLPQDGQGYGVSFRFLQSNPIGEAYPIFKGEANTTLIADLDFTKDYYFRVIEFSCDPTKYLNAGNTSLVYKATVTSISSQFTARELSITPNPSQDKVNINFESNYLGEVAVSLSDVLGNPQMTFTTEKRQSEFKQVLDISKLPQGTYILLVKFGDQVLQQRVVKL